MRGTFVVLTVLGVFLGTGLPPASPGNASDARKAWRGLLDRVAPRPGLHHRSLVVVPLVLKSAPAPTATEGPVVAMGGLSWSANAKGKGKSLGTATVSFTTPAAGLSADRLLPAGLVLRHGGHEWILLRPTLLEGGAVVRRRTVSLMPLDAPSPAADAPFRFGGVAPPEFAHTAFILPTRAALSDLLALEAALLEVGDPAKVAPTLEDILRRPAIAPRIAAAVKAIRPIGKAYSGETVGHVAYLGNRPVQFVLARAPATYASFVKHAVVGLALAVVAWEELYARAGLGVPAPSWPRYVEGVEQLVEDLAQVTARPERHLDAHGPAKTLWRMRATKGRRGRKSGEVGWLLLDAEARAVWIQAWPTGPLAKPASTPGGPGEGENPDALQGGAMTRPFLERFFERLRKLKVR